MASPALTFHIRHSYLGTTSTSTSNSNRSVTCFAISSSRRNCICTRRNGNNIILAAVVGLGNMHLLVVPVEYKITSTENTVSQDLLVCCEDHANVARVGRTAQIQNKVLQWHANRLTSKSKVYAASGRLGRTRHLVVAFAIIRGIKSAQYRYGYGGMHAGNCRPRVQHNIGIGLVDCEAG